MPAFNEQIKKICCPFFIFKKKRSAAVESLLSTC